MATEILPIDLGFDRCYVLRSRGVMAVDAGPPNRGRTFAEGLRRASIDPRDVRLLLLTHGHWDHIGSAREIKDLTGARIAMHRRDAGCLERSEKPLSPGVTPWGRLLRGLHAPFMPLVKIPPAKVDLPLEDDGLPLADHGIPGRVLHTPGHTAGSVSVLLDTGDAFVGDLAMNRFPLRLSPGPPIFADDLEAVSASWRLLLALGARTVYPAHGSPFPAGEIRRALP